MPTTQGTQVTLTVPDGAPPGTLLSVPVRGGAESLKIRVPDGMGAGSTLVLTQAVGTEDWDVKVGNLVPLSPEEQAMLQQQQAADQEGALEQQALDEQNELERLWMEQQGGWPQAETQQVMAAPPPQADPYEQQMLMQQQQQAYEQRQAYEQQQAYEEQQAYEQQLYEQQLYEQQMQQQQQQQQQEYEQQQQLYEQQQQQQAHEQQQQQAYEQQQQQAYEQQLALEQQQQGYDQPIPPAMEGAVAHTVRFETTVGVIDIIVRPDWAPHGTRRFLELAASGDLNELAFYRAIKGCIVQYGLPAKRQWPAIPDDPPTGVPFLLGAVSFAAVGENSRKSTLFICIGDMSHCLGQNPWETPIGAVAESSLDVLDRIETIYGDIAEFNGAGPDTNRINVEGTGYLRTNFPLLTWIQGAQPLDWQAPEDIQQQQQQQRQMQVQQVSAAPPLMQGGACDRARSPSHPLLREQTARAEQAAIDAQQAADRAAQLAQDAARAQHADAAAQAAQAAQQAAEAARQAADQALAAAHQLSLMPVSEGLPGVKPYGQDMNGYPNQGPPVDVPVEIVMSRNRPSLVPPIVQQHQQQQLPPQHVVVAPCHRSIAACPHAPQQIMAGGAASVVFKSGPVTPTQAPQVVPWQQAQPMQLPPQSFPMQPPRSMNAVQHLPAMQQMTSSSGRFVSSTGPGLHPAGQGFGPPSPVRPPFGGSLQAVNVTPGGRPLSGRR